MMTRREYLAATAGAAAAFASFRLAAAAEKGRPMPKFGMCDWSMNQMAKLEAFEVAKQIGLDGVQVSLGTMENKMWLREKEVQDKYLQTARQNGQQICSVAIAEMNNVGLMNEPRAAVWVADSIEVARSLKVDNVLMAFFHKGELKGSNAEDMRRVTEVLAELAPRAEKAGVALGIESYLSAEDHLKILDAIKSKAIQVYYDLKNTADAGYDPIASMKMIGADRICQVHFKDDPALENGSGKVDWPKAVEALHEMNYKGWIVLETPCPSDVLADTKKNLAYAKKLFSV